MEHNVRGKLILTAAFGLVGAVVTVPIELLHNYKENRKRGDGMIRAATRHVFGTALHGAVGGALSGAFLVNDRW